MKQLVCEMCGSTDLIKDGGVFVCQTCGCKYTVDEAKKMMVEGTVEVTGTVKVDNTDSIESYLKMADNAFSAKNYKEAEEYANKIIEINPQNSEAWNIKGKAAGWRDVDNNAEAVAAWVNAVTSSNVTEQPKLKEEIASEFCRLINGCVIYKANFCCKFSIISESDIRNLLKYVDNAIELMNYLDTKIGIIFNRSSLYKSVSLKLNSTACAIYKIIEKEYGVDNSYNKKKSREKFVPLCDLNIKVLETALALCPDNALGINICNNMIAIEENVRDSFTGGYGCSGHNTHDVPRDVCFTREEEAERIKKIKEYKNYSNYFKENVMNDLLQIIKKEREKEEIERGKNMYWKEHDSEKKQFEYEKRLLESEKEDIVRQMNNLCNHPVQKQADNTLQKISDLKSKQNGLGFFKGKEKKIYKWKSTSVKTYTECN